MDLEKLRMVKENKGFIAALDQSGGSSAKTLKAYGINEDEYSTEEEMFDLIHEMRKRVFTSKVFNKEHILGTILFEKTRIIIPNIIKTIPKQKNIIVVLVIVGTGLHPGNFCCLNFEFFNFSYSSFSSSLFSIVYF